MQRTPFYEVFFCVHFSKDVLNGYVLSMKPTPPNITYDKINCALITLCLV